MFTENPYVLYFPLYALNIAPKIIIRAECDVEDWEMV
jgi:hypothetical protein